MPGQLSFRPRRGPREREEDRLDDVAAWARTADGDLTLGEAEARLARSRGLTVDHVLGARDSRHEGGALQVLRPLAWVRWAGLVAIPFLPLLLVPRRTMSTSRLANHGRAEFLLNGIEVAYGLVVLVQVALLLAWCFRPAHAQRERVVGAVSVLVAAPCVVFSTVIVVIGSVVESWTGAALALLLAAVLAAANLLAHLSLRTVRRSHARDVRRIRDALRDDDDWRSRGPGQHGPVTSLGRAVATMDESRRRSLQRDQARVLDALADRGKIDQETARAAAELPLGRWGELER